MPDALRSSSGDRGSDVRDRLYAIAAALFKTTADRLRPASTPDTVRGWDSLAHMELVTALERTFGVRFKAREILSMRSLRDAERLLAAKLAET